MLLNMFEYVRVGLRLSFPSAGSCDVLIGGEGVLVNRVEIPDPAPVKNIGSGRKLPGMARLCDLTRPSSSVGGALERLVEHRVRTPNLLHRLVPILIRIVGLCALDDTAEVSFKGADAADLPLVHLSVEYGGVWWMR